MGPAPQGGQWPGRRCRAGTRAPPEDGVRLGTDKMQNLNDPACPKVGGLLLIARLGWLDIGGQAGGARAAHGRTRQTDSGRYMKTMHRAAPLHAPAQTGARNARPARGARRPAAQGHLGMCGPSPGPPCSSPCSGCPAQRSPTGRQRGSRRSCCSGWSLRGGRRLEGVTPGGRRSCLSLLTRLST